MKLRDIQKKKEKLFVELKGLYRQMDEAYNRIATEIGLTCKGCVDNCCVSYFQHHTHIEWAYLWEGLMGLSQQERDSFVNLAREYEEKAKEIKRRGERIEIMCPINKNGLCQLYTHRLMICRLHGVPNLVRMPKGETRHFSGCIKCREIIKGKNFFPVMDRTPFYLALARLEKRFVLLLKSPLSKVDHTLAQFLLMGPPC